MAPHWKLYSCDNRKVIGLFFPIRHRDGGLFIIESEAKGSLKSRQQRQILFGTTQRREIWDDRRI
jgi:hypothetical protein